MPKTNDSDVLFSPEPDKIKRKVSLSFQEDEWKKLDLYFKIKKVSPSEFAENAVRYFLNLKDYQAFFQQNQIHSQTHPSGS